MSTSRRRSDPGTENSVSRTPVSTLPTGNPKAVNGSSDALSRATSVPPDSTNACSDATPRGPRPPVYGSGIVAGDSPVNSDWYWGIGDHKGVDAVRQSSLTNIGIAQRERRKAELLEDVTRPAFVDVAAPRPIEPHAG